ncbi:DUF3108 domain-containing protein [Enterococcus faecalis]|uniref:DUF3108 domain-containing protein n=1 Tax=Enterococcus faecalis TaxID=1351 RepID=UPI00115AF86E|nr:DUF3108 domain-containing protein [Enterococcus faecalis]MBT9729031.1 DUF3108 domain-containing protein [Enterococcus faecalis]HAP5617132.1 DUF3108 domain-containing protein [Enterococcus faecalis]
MNKFIIKIGLFTLICIGILSGCSQLSNKIKYNNIDEKDLADAPLELMNNIPWADYQKASYTIYNREEETGEIGIEITKSIDTKFYNISKIKKNGSDEIQSGVTIVSDTLMPTKSYYNKKSNSKNENYEISTSYTKDWYVKTESEKSSEQTIDLPEYYYDNESLLIILGVLSYEEADTFKLNDTVPLTGRITPLEIKYEGKEQISVPYSETECYKVILDDMTFWYSIDDRILYQYKKGSTVYKLVNINYN